MASIDRCELIDVSPELIEQWIADGETVLVDVREDFEYASERIEHAQHHSLAKLDCQQIREHYNGKRIVFQCRTGGRSSEAAVRFGDEQVFHLCGGIEAWKASGRSVLRSEFGPKLDIMRQVQVAAGTIILTGLILGTLVNPIFYGISAFVGCGLTFAGLTGWCGMAMLLGKMPWNRSVITDCGSCPAKGCTDLATDF